MKNKCLFRKEKKKTERERGTDLKTICIQTRTYKNLFEHICLNIAHTLWCQRQSQHTWPKTATKLKYGKNNK